MAELVNPLRAVSYDDPQELRSAVGDSDRRLIVAMEQTAQLVGPDFLRSAAQLLSALLGVQYVFIAECVNAAESQARTLSFWADGAFGENFEFCAADGPCEQVIGGDVLHVEQGVVARFPDNEALRSLAPESYFGCPLVSSRNRVIGHIAAMDGRPMRLSKQDLVILRILASRAAAELERLQMERRRTADLVRHSEERFRLAQEAAEIGTWDMDVKTGRGTWSDAYWGIYGLVPDSLAPGYEAWLALVHPEDRSRVGGEIQEALGGGAPYRSEFRIVWPDGAVRWLVGRGSVFRDEAGAPVRMIGVDYDVTERKAQEEELRRLNEEQEQRVAERTKELQEANARLETEMSERMRIERQIVQTQKLESLGVLTAGVAHDFNNLLMTITGNADLARLKAGANPAVEKYLRRTLDAAERATEVTRQLLSYSGEMKVYPEVFELSRLVEDMAELLELTAGPRVSLRMEPSADAVYVRADGTQIRQVVMNLITNAAEAMPGGGEVRVRTRLAATLPAGLGSLYLSGSPGGGPHALIEVVDGGDGLSRETCSKIFDPFFTTKFLGRGLGLAAVLGIVRTHDGVIAVDGAEGTGASFTVVFPAASKPGPGQGEVRSAAAMPGRVSGTVLVVDDEAEVLRTAHEIFVELGLEVVVADSGARALELFEQRRDEIAAVILDHAMPGMDGAETLRRLKKVAPEARVLLTSGYSEIAVTDAPTSPAPDGFLPKPYTVERCERALRAVLERTD